MDFEALLSTLEQSRICRSVLKKLDDASREKLINCVKTAVASDKIEDSFLDCCGEFGLADMGGLEELNLLSADDNESKLSTSDVQMFSDELLKIVGQIKANN